MSYLRKTLAPYTFEDKSSWFFMIITAAMSMGFICWQSEFVRLGFPLSVPLSLGSIPYFHPKIFIFELFIALSVIFALWFRIKRREGFSTKDPLFLLSATLLFITILRLVFSIDSNPLLAIRNSSFGWYLLLPLALSVIPEISLIVENVSFFSLSLSFCVFLLSFVKFIAGDSLIMFLPFVGAYPFLFLALTKNSRISSFFLVILGLACGLGFYYAVQRTVLVGFLMMVVAIIAFSHRFSVEKKVVIKKLVIFAACFSFSAVLYPFEKEYLICRWESAPAVCKAHKTALERGATTPEGLEQFRVYMWRDAFNLFKSKPLVGIGFQKQVVYRIIYGTDYFVPNDGASVVTILGQPPIAGPHNSYLNALARLGIAGILFLVLHLGVLIRLLKSDYFWTFWAVYSQILYAFFNVGLEGPVRSFLLLLGIASALAISGGSGKPAKLVEEAP